MQLTDSNTKMFCKWSPARWWSRRLRDSRLRRGVGKLFSRNLWKLLLPSVLIMP